MPLIDFLPALGLVGILWYGGHQVLDGNLPGRRHRRRQPLRPDADLAAAHDRHARRAGVPRLGRGAGASTTSSSTDPAIDDAPHASSRCPTAPGEVRFEGVTFGYGDGPARARRARPRDPPAARRSRSSARPRRARRRSPASSRASTTSTPATCCIDGADVRDVRLRDVRPRGRARVRGHVPVLRHRARRTSRSPIPRRRWTPSCARRGSRAPTTSSRAARRLRDDHRRARLLALGRSAPAHRDRPGRARRSAHPDPRRRDVVGRPDQGARDPRRARRGDAGPDDDHHRPPARDDRARRPRRAARRRPGRRRRHARRLLATSRAVPRRARAGRRHGPSPAASSTTSVDESRDRLMRGCWATPVPEETLSRDEAHRVVRRLLAHAAPAGAVGSCVATLRADGAGRARCSPVRSLVRHGIDAGFRSRTTPARSTSPWCCTSPWRLGAFVLGRLAISSSRGSARRSCASLRNRLFRHLHALVARLLRDARRPAGSSRA